MKKFLALLLFGFMFLGLAAQEKSDLPNITLKTLDGKSINISEISNDGKPIVFLFCYKGCVNCVKEHDNISEVYDEWVDETGVKIYSIYIDDARHSAGLKPYVDGKNWPFEAIHDVNRDLYRAFNVTACPHTLLFNGDGKLVWQHNSYFNGCEDVLYQEILKISK